ncbi:hypothetical protein J7E96_35960 [Streptomyces sp. ISL-96]|uniref:hypothetical protein n=1 Tax=Streptomyces sp. ISL-96 TaxID=2819191 RepID=UPI001BE610FC|nr:hypothetical protein [Streptomyces sp. ISL-96]MBT2493799.1 hypothetical protein [Streptomyces sp. ISL-96]
MSGEVLSPGAGIPHACLSGLGVEIMTASDNVPRCGLTPKRIDSAELLRIIRFTVLLTRVLSPAADGQEGERVIPRTGRRLPSLPLLCTRGKTHLGGERGSLTLRPGDAAYIPRASLPVPLRNKNRN